MAQTPCCVQHVCLQLPAVNLGSEEVLATGGGSAFAFNAAPGTGGAAQATPCKSKVGVHAGAFCIHRIHCGEKEGDKRRAAGGEGGDASQQQQRGAGTEIGGWEAVLCDRDGPQGITGPQSTAGPPQTPQNAAMGDPGGMGGWEAVLWDQNEPQGITGPQSTAGPPPTPQNAAVGRPGRGGGRGGGVLAPTMGAHRACCSRR